MKSSLSLLFRLIEWGRRLHRTHSPFVGPTQFFETFEGRLVLSVVYENHFNIPSDLARVNFKPGVNIAVARGKEAGDFFSGHSALTGKACTALKPGDCRYGPEVPVDRYGIIDE